MNPQTVPELQSLVLDRGEGVQPDLFFDLYFVIDQGTCVTVTTDFEIAYAHWVALAKRRPLVESSLEHKVYGRISSIEPATDARGARLIIIDGSNMVKHE